MLLNSVHTWLIKPFLMAVYYFRAEVCCFTGCHKPKHLMSSLQPPWTFYSFPPHVPQLVLTHSSLCTAGHSLGLFLILPIPPLLSALYETVEKQLLSTGVSDAGFYLTKRSLKRKKTPRELQKTNLALLSNYIHSFVLSLFTPCNIA